MSPNITRCSSCSDKSEHMSPDVILGFQINFLPSRWKAKKTINAYKHVKTENGIQSRRRILLSKIITSFIALDYAQFE